MLGASAGVNLTSGSNNICIGQQAGGHNVALSTGSQNILIGNFSDTSASDSGLQIALGYNVSCTGNSNFTFGGNTSDSNIAFGATSISAPSDIRLKEDIKDETVGLEFINELRPVTFRWKKAKDVPSELKVHSDSEERVMNGKYNHGFIAQEVKEVLDEYNVADNIDVWNTDSKGVQMVNENKLIIPLIKAVQELSAKVDAMQIEINNLK